MVTNMPWLAVSQISRLITAMRAAGSRSPLPRQRKRLAVFAIRSAAFMPLPETSPTANAMAPSSRSKKSKKSPETLRAGRVRPHTGEVSGSERGNRFRCISAASSSSWLIRFCSATTSDRLAFEIARAVRLDQARSKSTSHGANRRSCTWLSSIAPLGRACFASARRRSPESRSRSPAIPLKAPSKVAFGSLEETSSSP